MKQFEGIPEPGTTYLVTITETNQYQVPVTAEPGDGTEELKEQAHHLVTERDKSVSERIIANITMVYTEE